MYIYFSDSMYITDKEKILRNTMMSSFTDSKAILSVLIIIFSIRETHLPCMSTAMFYNVKYMTIGTIRALPFSNVLLYTVL